MLHIFIDILFVLVILILLYVAHKKVTKCRKNSEELIKILNANIDFLDSYYEKRELEQLRKFIQLYSKFKIIMNISNCDFVSFYKYNYYKNFIKIKFIVSVDKNSNISENSDIDNIPVTSNKTILNIINCHNETGLCNAVSDDIDDEYICDLFNRHNINKIYFTNILNDVTPKGFILLSYKDKNYKMNKDDESEVLRITKKIKRLV